MHCDACGHDQPAGRFCGHCGALLEDVTAPSPGQRPVWFPRAVLGVLAVAVAVAAIVLLGGRGTDSDPSGHVEVPSDASNPAIPRAPEEADPPQGPLFGERTRTTLLLDDGVSGVVALDLDTGRQVALAVPGQRPGNRPYRLLRRGLELVVGGGGVSVTMPGEPEPARELGDDATLFLPAADPDTVWLITWEGGQVGAGRSTWELVDVAGTLRHRARGVEGLRPLRGVPDGLALRTAADRLVTYDITEQALVDGVGIERAVIGDAMSDRVVWCDAPCGEAHVTGPAAAVVALDAQDVDRFLVGRGTTRLSPDGSLVALPARVWVDDTQAVDFQLRVHETATGALVASTSVPLGEPHSAWTDDGEQLLFTVAFRTDPVPEGSPHMLGRWTETSGFELVDVGNRNLPRGTFATYPAEAAASWF